jgi:hypothetical protein
MKKLERFGTPNVGVCTSISSHLTSSGATFVAVVQPADLENSDNLESSAIERARPSSRRGPAVILGRRLGSMPNSRPKHTVEMLAAASELCGKRVDPTGSERLLQAT